MMAAPIQLTALVAVVTLLAGCWKSTANDQFTGWFAPYADCREHYTAIDTRIDEAGVRDAGYYRVPGYPYLRTDRVLASFADEVETVSEVSGWLRKMRQLDQEAREFEYINLGLPLRERALLRETLLACGSGLAAVELDTDEALAELRALAQPPDEYSTFARTIGMHMLASPLLHSKISNSREKLKKRFSGPLPPQAENGNGHLWTVTAAEDPELIPENFRDTAFDLLGFPGLVASQWRALAELHSPALWDVAPEGEALVPGRPKWEGQQRVSIDPNRPVMHFHVTFTRFGDQRLAQINYSVWFGGARATSGGSDLDGFIWRVTLDQDADPLVYEYLHASGREHMLFPAQPLQLREDHDNHGGDAVIPQPVLPNGRPVLVLQPGSPMLERLVTLADAPSAKRSHFELERYEHLFTLATPAGGHRSLFDPKGRVPGTAGRPASDWMWSSGVSAPRALRQLGRHPISYTERMHFDDARLLESIFKLPEPRD